MFVVCTGTKNRVVVFCGKTEWLALLSRVLANSEIAFLFVKSAILPEYLFRDFVAVIVLNRHFGLGGVS